MNNMDGHVVLTGMVLTAMPVGDYDKRITILTTERGKITAFARGARRPNSQLLAPTNPFCFGEFELAEGRNAYTLMKANIRNYFRELTADPEAAYTGFYFLEFASYLCQENNDEKEMLKLLYQSLRALISPHFKKELVRRIFEFRALVINGQGLQLFQCTCCGKKITYEEKKYEEKKYEEKKYEEKKSYEEKPYLSLSRGGVLCDKCRTRFPGFPISPTVLYTMQFITVTKVEKLFSFALKEKVLDEFSHITEQYVSMYVRHNFRSLEVLDGLMFP